MTLLWSALFLDKTYNRVYIGKLYFCILDTRTIGDEMSADRSRSRISGATCVLYKTDISVKTSSYYPIILLQPFAKFRLREIRTYRRGQTMSLKQSPGGISTSFEWRIVNGKVAPNSKVLNQPAIITLCAIWSGGSKHFGCNLRRQQSCSFAVPDPNLFFLVNESNLSADTAALKK